MSELLTILHEAKLIGVSTSDPADLQFRILATGVPEFKNFDFYKERMGNFYVTISGEKPKFKELFIVVKLACILFDENATVESDFSSTQTSHLKIYLKNLLLLKGRFMMEFASLRRCFESWHYKVYNKKCKHIT